MTSWFDIFHYTLVGFGVCFLILLIILACQGIVKVILLAYGNKDQQTTFHHTHSEEHHVHHVHHAVTHEQTAGSFETIFGSSAPSSGSKSVEYKQIPQSRPITRAISKNPVR